MGRMECWELAPADASLIGLRQGRDSWESLPLPARQQSLMLIGWVGWYYDCTHGSNFLSFQWGGWSVQGSWECPTCWPNGGLRKCYPYTYPLFCGDSSVQSSPLWHSSCWCQIFLTASSVFYLSGTSRAWLSSTSGWSLGLLECSNSPWSPALLITKTHCNLDSCS